MRSLAARARGASGWGWAAALSCAASVACLLALEVVAIFNRYEVRVTSDTPTFIALLRDLAVHPFHQASVFFGTPGTDSIHASPYMQALALIWRACAPAGHLQDPLAIARFLAIVTIPVTIFVLVALYAYVSSLAGRRAGLFAVPALLLAFGPVSVTFASDMSLGGFLATGYFPTTFAMGLILAALVALRHRGFPASLAAMALIALTITSDPFNGVIICILAIIAASCASLSEPSEATRIPCILTGAFLLAQSWHLFSTFGSFAASDLPVPLVIVLAFAIPRLWLRAQPFLRRRLAVVLAWRPGETSERRLAFLGAYACALIAIWGVYTMRHWPAAFPILRSFRLGFYWNDARDRWLLLLLPGVCAVIGLWRLGRRGHMDAGLWLVLFLAAGLVGAAIHLSTQIEVPLYDRFILLAQLPIAVGLGAYLAHPKSHLAAWVVGATLAGSLVFKVATLLLVANNLSYFGTPPSTVWNLGRVIPPGSGVVASDPSTSYYIPAVTRDRVLTLSQGHADSGRELKDAEAGYLVMHRLFAGDGEVALGAFEQLARRGVRYVVAEKFTTMTPANLVDFYFEPYESLVSREDLPLLARYYSRLLEAGHVVYDDNEYTVFHLEPTREAHYEDSAPLGEAYRAAISVILSRVPYGDEVAAAGAAAELRSLGVARVTLTLGEIGGPPHLEAYAAGLRTEPFALAVPAPTASCEDACLGTEGIAEVEGFGSASRGEGFYEDSRFIYSATLGRG
jgi:hypothetical protein